MYRLFLFSNYYYYYYVSVNRLFRFVDFFFFILTPVCVNVSSVGVFCLRSSARTFPRARTHARKYDDRRLWRAGGGEGHCFVYFAACIGTHQNNNNNNTTGGGGGGIVELLAAVVQYYVVCVCECTYAPARALCVCVCLPLLPPGTRPPRRSNS